ncbi:hypothetical protein A3H53_01150 [Candidatus Nomurabacteria bacterium RIFCSPLOWO2_02_FULL_40_10]|uniref:Metallopeptidase family protein n=1 Tax=Candidatus Nomurabacteria bacterium RIFCSPLOWO2_02_FULL_40_10 TaxID=1801786 RepID=A0A1F6XX51_9BACT|nr:MAG: hypothetical protein A3H53_01150 [Candidatus Nomurabacteria bacterium RIFCSPLOWO2_02_FULL_40_10]
MTQEKFGEIVAEGIDAIPEKFLRKLSNVAVVIENNPTSEQRKKLKLRHNWTLFGLYEGIPQSARLGNYTGVLPDKITIFQKPIEDEAESEEEVKEIVKNTVWHEIAHHFGMDESAVRKAEEKRRIKRF